MVRLRFSIVLVICLLALAPLQPAFAQETGDVSPPVICGDLPRKIVRCWRIQQRRYTRGKPLCLRARILPGSDQLPRRRMT